MNAPTSISTTVRRDPHCVTTKLDPDASLSPGAFHSVLWRPHGASTSHADPNRSPCWGSAKNSGRLGQKQRNLNKTLRSFGIVKTLRCIVERQRNVARCQDLMLPTTLSHHVHVHMKFYVQLRVQKQNLCMCTHLDVRQMCELNVNVKSYEKEKV